MSHVFEEMKKADESGAVEGHRVVVGCNAGLGSYQFPTILDMPNQYMPNSRKGTLPALALLLSNFCHLDARSQGVSRMAETSLGILRQWVPDNFKCRLIRRVMMAAPILALTGCTTIPAVNLKKPVAEIPAEYRK